ncbi:UNVERIFIED_CONTAM: Retrovirus-related Pol polyprotein from transposon TNT 1-94 [Sesamum radiatum]|uniref:Retrovirus-related Pol polyprotein from transposon TNT 1-94 n=1 Tax=Sesamum radiatum TaxID=300843 RepID=A0AAW2L2A2_SESRA
MVSLRKRSLWINRRVSLLLEKNRKSVVSKGPSIASSKLPEVGTQVLMSGELILESFQSDDDNAKSQSGFVLKLNGGVVAWKSSKQDTTANSTTKFEYIAASQASKEAVWMKNYIQELGVVPSIVEPVVIFCDNNGAIAQAKELRSHHRSKHILRRYHRLREMVSRGDCRMDRISSTENKANPLTKPMSQVAHTQYLDKMGLSSMGDWL